MRAKRRTKRKPLLQYYLRLFLRRPVRLNLRLRFLRASELHRFLVHRERRGVFKGPRLVENKTDTPEHDACEREGGMGRVRKQSFWESATFWILWRTERVLRERVQIDGLTQRKQRARKTKSHNTYLSTGTGSRSTRTLGRNPRSTRTRTQSSTETTRRTA